MEICVFDVAERQFGM